MGKAWRDSHKQEIAEYNKSYQKKNRSMLSGNVKAKKQSNIKYKIRSNLQTRFSDRLRYYIKPKGMMQLLGCSLDQFISHIESKFQPGMSWNNYGKWHIDHIIPCSAFDFNDPNQQAICFNYKNTQPLWEYQNKSKKDKPYMLLTSLSKR